MSERVRRFGTVWLLHESGRLWSVMAGCWVNSCLNHTDVDCSARHLEVAVLELPPPQSGPSTLPPFPARRLFLPALPPGPCSARSPLAAPCSNQGSKRQGQSAFSFRGSSFFSRKQTFSQSSQDVCHFLPLTRRGSVAVLPARERGAGGATSGHRSTRRWKDVARG